LHDCGALFNSDDDINGEAFMDLKDSDLIEMEFKKGQRMKIVKIIQSIKVRKSIESGSIIIVYWNSYIHSVGR
jgi:hypothetical protein